MDLQKLQAVCDELEASIGNGWTFTSRPDDEVILIVFDSADKLDMKAGVFTGKVTGTGTGTETGKCEVYGIA